MMYLMYSISLAYYKANTYYVYQLQVHIDTTKEIRGQFYNCSLNNGVWSAVAQLVECRTRSRESLEVGQPGNFLPMMLSARIGNHAKGYNKRLHCIASACGSPSFHRYLRSVMPNYFFYRLLLQQQCQWR